MTSGPIAMKTRVPKLAMNSQEYQIHEASETTVGMSSIELLSIPRLFLQLRHRRMSANAAISIPNARRNLSVSAFR